MWKVSVKLFRLVKGRTSLSTDNVCRKRWSLLNTSDWLRSPRFFNRKLLSFKTSDSSTVVEGVILLNILCPVFPRYIHWIRWDTSKRCLEHIYFALLLWWSPYKRFCPPLYRIHKHWKISRVKYTLTLGGKRPSTPIRPSTIDIWTISYACGLNYLFRLLHSV